MRLEVCPSCRVHVKVDEKGKYVQHARYVAKQGIWIKGSTCKNSGKKVKA